MSAIADQIAVEHRAVAASNGTGTGLAIRCACGPLWHEDYPSHVAEVTEAAVRARIATELEAEGDRATSVGRSFAFSRAARIAKGGA